MSVWIHGVKSSTRKRKRIFKSFGDLSNLVKALCLAESQSEGLFVVCGQCRMFFVLFSESMKNFFHLCVFSKFGLPGRKLGISLFYLFLFIPVFFFWVGLFVYI